MRGAGPLSPAEVKEYDAYLRGLRKGREAAKKGDYAAAIAALTGALTHWQNDARAYSERGYVYWLADRPSEGLADLERARAIGGDKVLRAQVEYNVGLVLQKQGKAAEARVAFARSNELNPTPAAARKVADVGAGCKATVDSAPVEGKAYAGWAAALSALKEADEKKGNPWGAAATPADGSDEAAKALLVGKQEAKTSGPWVSRLERRVRFLSELPGGVIVHDIAEEQTSLCGDESPHSVDLFKGPLVRVVVESHVQERPLVCSCSGSGPSDDDTCPPGETRDCRLAACGPVAEAIIKELVFDPSGRRRLLTIEESAPVEQKGVDAFSVKRNLSLALSPTSIRLQGGGCDRTVTVVATSPPAGSHSNAR